VTIVRKRHPFCGRTLQVFGWMRRQGRLDLILVLPDGSRSLIPAAWTDLGADETAGLSSEVLGSLGDLRRARTVVDGLIHRSRDAISHDGRDRGEVARAASAGSRGRSGGSRRRGELGGRGSPGRRRVPGGTDGEGRSRGREQRR
jgi:hypothetical protein